MSVSSLTIVSNGTSLTVGLGQPFNVDGLIDFRNYDLRSADPQSFPVTMRSIVPNTTPLSSGSNAQTLAGNQITLPGHTFSMLDIGSYIFLDSPFNTVSYARITSIVGSDTVTVDKSIVGSDLNVPYTLTTGVTSLTITTTKPTNGGTYLFSLRNAKTAITGEPMQLISSFTADAALPRISSVNVLDDGQFIVTFTDPMLADSFLTSKLEYAVTGPSIVQIESVNTLSPTQVVIKTNGLGTGSYLLTVNATGTPHDSAGNPIDPLFNTAIFSGSVPTTVRSIFVDHGPITKPPLVLQSGVTATIVDAQTVALPGASVSPSMLGLSLTLTTATNGGTFRITSIVSATRVKVAASFHLPDAQNGNITWQLFDPRDGVIADDPTDVTVRINNVPTAAASVVGLLGQIIMPTAPSETDIVSVDYHWVVNPVVDFRRMNSKEFRFNNWDRDIGRPNDASRHKYRYNNTLIQPPSFVPLDIRAAIAQPEQRDLKYRAYERAYTAVFNDPNLLLFNSPVNHIAFPPLSRPISPVSVNYQAIVLPETDPFNPWTRLGTGAASIVNNTLVIQDNSAGPFPGGQPIFWTRPIDLTYPHVFAIAWRMLLSQDPITEGVFTGVAAGYSDDRKAVVVGYLDDGGIHKIGFLKAGAGNDPSLISSWSGGLDGSGNPTGLPFVFDWSTIHSYRLFRDQDGTIRLFFDGSVVESLRITEPELPFLEELSEPFTQLQGTFFGSISRPAANTSTWNFLLYSAQPLNPFQTAPSVFVSYEGTTTPEVASQPWTPVGFHGTETISNNTALILDSTSATDLSTEAVAGLVGGDFKGFVRIEPLLRASSDVVLDVNVSLRTFTSGVTPNAVMAAVDDGTFLAQLCFFADQSAPKFSYGGRSFPDQFSPYFWSKTGGATPSMVGQTLRISDASTSDGLVYFLDDVQPPSSITRVASSLNDYILEFRVKVISHTPDVGGFSGVWSQAYDGARAVGVMLQEVLGQKYVTLASDGVPVVGGQFAFNWDDGKFHTYRLVKNTIGSLVSLFVDTVFIGTVAYSAFTFVPASPDGMISFGSSSPASMQAQSVVDWAYANCWRVLSGFRTFVGMWKGYDADALTGYHLPLKVTGRNALVNGNALGDPLGNFIVNGVSVGDQLIVDTGLNKGVYTVASVSAQSLTVNTPSFPVTPSNVAYRIVTETDWTTPHRYRLVRDPGGGVSIFLDTIAQPLIRVGYNNIDLPSSVVGISRILAGGLPSVVFGAFDPTNLSQTAWDFVRYGVTRPINELGIVPHHQVMNQRNVMASYEHHITNIPHTHTDFWSESEGIPPQTNADVLRNQNLVAYTLLNEGTPLVPLTQTYEVRRPTPVVVPIVGFNRPEDVLNAQAFVMNESAEEVKLIVPKDVLYDSLQVIERDTGSQNLIAPFDDESQPMYGTLSFQNTVCLTYDANQLPENDATAVTPWAFVATNPAHVNRSVFGGTLTYGTDATGTTTIYRNVTPLPDAISLQTEVKFRLKLLQDSTGGTGDTQVRFGFSSIGLTMALAFVTTPLGERYVLIVDLNNNAVVGGIPFDFNDSSYHTYRVVRDPGQAAVQVFIDS